MEFNKDKIFDQIMNKNSRLRHFLLENAENWSGKKTLLSLSSKEVKIQEIDKIYSLIITNLIKLNHLNHLVTRYRII